MKKFRDIGIKLTPQRLAILNFLEGNTDHPSADQIFASVKEKYPTMSFATVYNTVEALRQKGVVRELSIDPAKKHFDPNTEAHHHLICNKCRIIVDIHIDYDLSLSDNDRKGFEITGTHIEFYGVCPGCRSEKRGLEKVEENSGLE